MEEKQGYGAGEIASDLKRLGEEIETDTERTLAEMRPIQFCEEEWNTMREAVKGMRESLDRIDELIERKSQEAAAFDDEAEEDRYERYWE